MLQYIDYSRYMDINAALGSFEALSQETRLDVVRLLVRAGPEGRPAGRIAEELDCRQNTMSAHLKILQAAGLLESERNGRSIIYKASYSALGALIRFLMEDCCAGNAEICGRTSAQAHTDFDSGEKR